VDRDIFTANPARCKCGLTAPGRLFGCSSAGYCSTAKVHQTKVTNNWRPELETGVKNGMFRGESRSGLFRSSHPVL